MSTQIENAIQQLGCKATDKITGFAGVITSIFFDLAGCIQPLITAPADKEGKVDSRWFDLARLNIGKRVMAAPVPTVNTGSVEKPLPPNA